MCKKKSVVFFGLMVFLSVIFSGGIVSASSSYREGDLEIQDIDPI
jgi:hypothetical protein